MQRGQVQIAMPAMIAVALAVSWPDRCRVRRGAAARSRSTWPQRAGPHGLCLRRRRRSRRCCSLHIRVTMPWLFHGWFLRFWPLVVMAIAFVGVGLGEVFQRRRQRVLSEPLRNDRRTAAIFAGAWFLGDVEPGALLAAVTVNRRAVRVAERVAEVIPVRHVGGGGRQWQPVVFASRSRRHELVRSPAAMVDSTGAIAPSSPATSIASG